MKERILKTLKAYLHTNKDVLSQEEIDYYVDKYGIVFNEEGKIVDRFLAEDEIADLSSEDLKEWCNSAAGIDNN